MENNIEHEFTAMNFTETLHYFNRNIRNCADELKHLNLSQSFGMLVDLTYNDVVEIEYRTIATDIVAYLIDNMEEQFNCYMSDWEDLVKGKELYIRNAKANAYKFLYKAKNVCLDTEVLSGELEKYNNVCTAIITLMCNIYDAWANKRYDVFGLLNTLRDYINNDYGIDYNIDKILTEAKEFCDMYKAYASGQTLKLKLSAKYIANDYYKEEYVDKIIEKARGYRKKAKLLRFLYGLNDAGVLTDLLNPCQMGTDGKCQFDHSNMKNFVQELDKYLCCSKVKGIKVSNISKVCKELYDGGSKLELRDYITDIDYRKGRQMFEEP